MTQQQQQQYAQQQQYGYAPSNYGQPPFGGFINDPTAQMGLQMGKTAVAAGQDYVEQNVSHQPSFSVSLLTRSLLSSIATSTSRP
jgi:hypothetical protein